MLWKQSDLYTIHSTVHTESFVLIRFICETKMGSPDLPNEENNISRPVASSLPMHGGNTTASDDSDVENIENIVGSGYQPLSLDEETMEYRNESNEQDNDNDDDADDNFDYSVCTFQFVCFFVKLPESKIDLVD